MKAVIECVQDIPCDPCVRSCPVKAISKKDLSTAPKMDESRCTGCANCVPRCPGRAIFVVGGGRVVVPYEFLPAPKKGAPAELLDREGRKVGTGKILAAREFDRTFAVAVSVPDGLEQEVRNIRIKWLTKQ